MKRQSYVFDVRDLIYILAVLVPVAVTWGIYTTKMTNLMDRVIEVRAENLKMKEEDVKLREIIHDIQLEVNDDHSDIRNLKQRVQDIIDTHDKLELRHERDAHENQGKN